ncbi:SRPBCC family protein [Aestuariimicrobium ganziense]|uniref:SRPBCC family protein n=1 Tax=Aestuariimicrobium ganziense TaxID=2773677 RepID=UPI00194558A9|nr:SRPBCC domain-containing protein [Aestuariimicrobium ganziense]
MSETTISEAPGEVQDTAVKVSRSVSHPLSSVWSALMTTEGAEALLGEGGRLGDKGHSWSATDGTHGVTRSFHPKEQIRFSWHADDDAPATIVDLHLAEADEGNTQLEIVHDHLPADSDRDALQDHWSAALDRIDALSL